MNREMNRELALESLRVQKEEREEHSENRITKSISEAKAERAKSRQEKLERDRVRFPVTPRVQPPRVAAPVDLTFCHPDSEDISDVSSDSYEVTEDEDATVTDTVDELISGVERENI